jgi:hypothetical protein
MSKLITFLKYCIPFTILLYFAQQYATTALGSQHDFFYTTWSIYLFQFVSSLLLYIILLFVHSKFPEYTGFAFMGITFFKMMASVVFLIPLIQTKGRETNLDIAAFFIPYFLFLFFETVFSVRLINKR